jgi:hypothetical protein
MKENCAAEESPRTVVGLLVARQQNGLGTGLLAAIVGV